MSFVANQPNPAPNTLQNLPALAADHGLFPDIDLNRLRQSIRIDGTVTPEPPPPSTSTLNIWD